MHYLSQNRFDWWHTEIEGKVPSTDPITALNGLGELVSIDERFYDEFRSPFGVVVGAETDSLQEPPKRVVSWADRQVGSSPNEIPNIEFKVSTRRRRATPALVSLSLRHGPVLVIRNSGADSDLDAPLAPDQADYIISFAVAQRAVGLECGLFRDPDAESDAVTTVTGSSVRLTARDKGGRVRTESSGRDLIGRDWQFNAVLPIGVRDASGGIRTVELSYRTGEGLPRASLFILRIWHEPLPPMAVNEATVDLSQGRTFPLPFGCDRAVAFLRGFKVRSGDVGVRPVKRMLLQLDGGAATNGSSLSVNAFFILDDGSSASVDTSTGFAYVSLVAWNHAQVNVNTAFAQVSTETEKGEMTAILPDPALSNGRMYDPNQDPFARSGELFGALKGLDINFREPSEIDKLEFFTGIMGGTGFGSIEGPGAAKAGYTVITSPSLTYAGDSIVWNIGANIEGDEPGRSVLNGVVMNGACIRGAVADRVIFDARNEFGPRQAGDWNGLVSDSSFNSTGCDLVFLGLPVLRFEPEGSFRELEAEVGGVSFNGTLVVWHCALGIDVQPPISSAGDDFVRSAYIFPSFGGLVRGVVSVVATLIVQDILFDALEGAVSLRPKQLGLITNGGNVTVMVMSAILQGPDASEFEVVLEHRGILVPLPEYAAHLPIELRAGEELQVGGAFRASGGKLSYTAELRLMTDVIESPEVLIQLSAVAKEANPIGSLLPGLINFGTMRNFSTERKRDPYPSSYTVVRHGLIINDGSTPLLVRSLTFAASTEGFHLIGFRQASPLPGSTFHYDESVLLEIQSNEQVIVDLGFTPTHIGQFETLLSFETNSGMLTMTLVAQVIELLG